MSDNHAEGRLVVLGEWLVPEAHADRMIGGSTNKAQDKTDYAHSIALVRGKYQNDEANAMRLAACWNACIGIGTVNLVNLEKYGGTLLKRLNEMQAETRLVESNYEAIRVLMGEILDAEYYYDDAELVVVLRNKVEKIRDFMKGKK